jgi:hypothetical protein
VGTGRGDWWEVGEVTWGLGEVTVGTAISDLWGYFSFIIGGKPHRGANACRALCYTRLAGKQHTREGCQVLAEYLLGLGGGIGWL